MSNPHEGWTDWLLIIFGGICYLLYKGWKRLFSYFFKGVKFPEDEDEKKAKESPQKGFFLSYQTRRRRLDLTREDNIVGTSVGKKVARQRKGMFNRFRRKK